MIYGVDDFKNRSRRVVTYHATDPRIKAFTPVSSYGALNP